MKSEMCLETQEWIVVSFWFNSCLLLVTKGRSHLLLNREKRPEELTKEKKAELEKRHAEEYIKKLEEEISALKVENKILEYERTKAEENRDILRCLYESKVIDGKGDFLDQNKMD